ncbi:hypothetical protein KEM54_001713, partial [Ascosphaera aggregata]
MSSSRTDSDRPTPVAKPFTLSKSLKSTTQIRPSRKPAFTSGIEEDGTEVEANLTIQQEELTGFENGSAVTTRKQEVAEPLVIQVTKRNNWRDRVRGRRAGPSTAQAEASTETIENTGQTVGLKAQYGLVYAPPLAATTGVDGVPKDETVEVPPTSEEKNLPKEPLNQDEAALQALLAESKADGVKKSNLVIRAPGSDSAAEPYDETRSFRADVASRPDPASLASYEAVPVEEFGAALLRGMGWKDGESVGRNRYGLSPANLKPRVPERRPGFLGIGAKEVPGKAGELEIGAWGKAAMRKAKNAGEGLYTPVVMKHKRTGETITEDEFKRLREAQEQEKQDRQKHKSRRYVETHEIYDRQDDYSDSEDTNLHRSR